MTDVSRRKQLKEQYKQARPDMVFLSSRLKTTGKVYVEAAKICAGDERQYVQVVRGNAPQPGATA